MKNLFKITAVVLVTFALASNIYASTFSFYGIKSNNISNNILASAMLSDNTSLEPGGGGSSSGGGSSWWDSPVNTSVQCGEAHVAGGETSAASAAGTISTTTNSAGQVIVTVTYGNQNNTNYTQTIPAHTATMRQCIGPQVAICTTITAMEACR